MLNDSENSKNLYKQEEIVCQVLNNAGIRSKHYNGNTRQIELSDFKAIRDAPGAAFGGGICGDKEAFHFLKKGGYIDRGFCWQCGQEPINNNFSFSDKRDPTITYKICENCWNRGSKLQKALGGNNQSACFIATLCYSGEFASEVVALRHFRDKKLIDSMGGMLFVKTYYAFSPSIVKILRHHPKIVELIRKHILDKLILLIK